MSSSNEMKKATSQNWQNKHAYLIFLRGKNSSYSVGDRNFPIKKNQTLGIIAFPWKKIPTLQWNNRPDFF